LRLDFLIAERVNEAGITEAANTTSMIIGLLSNAVLG
jgi:hypothetical protein